MAVVAADGTEGSKSTTTSLHASTAVIANTSEGDVSQRGSCAADAQIRVGSGGARKSAVQRLDKIRWSVLMEAPVVELVDHEEPAKFKLRDEHEEEAEEEDEEGEEEAGGHDQESQQLLSPRTMMARLEKKKSWQDITRNLKKFDFQSEKAKELREEREQREQARDGKKKDHQYASNKESRDESGGLLKAAKSAKKSLRYSPLLSSPAQWPS
jgi:hypothetical protein